MPQIKPLPAELQKIAIEELGEVPERLPEDLRALKTWIWQQPHLNARTDDQFLIQFLRGCKYNLEKAKQKLDYFYSMKTKYPDLFAPTNVDDRKFRQIQNTGAYVALPTPLNGCGPRIAVLRFTASPDEFSHSEFSRACVAASEVVLLSDPYACICGVIWVIDFALHSVKHTLAFSPSVVKNVATFYEKAYPIRFKAMYLINLSPLAEQFMKMLLPYTPDYIRHRIHICGSNIDELSEYLPKKYFPQDYGGENGSLNEVSAEFNKVWDDYRKYFQQNSEYGTNELLRVGRLYDNKGELGYGGSFRQLSVD